VAGVEAHTMVGLVTANTVGNGLTISLTLSVLKQLAFHFVSVYVVEVVGFTSTVFVVTAGEKGVQL
jgi:hypothetical protein